MTAPPKSIAAPERLTMVMRARAFLNNNALSLALVVLFVGATLAQIASGLAVDNHERVAAGRPPLDLEAYLHSGHFIEALFENWESEFLQMGIFVVLLVKLKQKGSAESKPCDEPFEGDEPSEAHRNDPDAPWPVRRGGAVLWLYENSLAFAFFGLFALSFVMHAFGGMLKENDDRFAQGQAPLSFGDELSSSQFWFESFQNWQSEFLAVLCIVVLTIFLRQHGSPQSKPVWAPHSKTGV